jgi:CheY-like chemotaxis protein
MRSRALTRGGSGAAGRIGRSGLRVLVVEDDDVVAEGLRLLLEQEHAVQIALGGRQALDLLLGATAFDVVLCDLMMPDMSGIDLFYALRTSSPGLERRLVFMTGGAFTNEAESFLAAIDNPRVEKPFDFSSGNQLLRRAAERSRPVSAD